MHFTRSKITNPADVKQTTIRLHESHALIHSMSNPDKSQWIEIAIVEFLAWETYCSTNWNLPDPLDGNIWLDAVEMGVEYRTRTKLLDPVKITLSGRIAYDLEVACKVVDRMRPNLKGKGVASGIVRTAITQKLYSQS